MDNTIEIKIPKNFYEKISEQNNDNLDPSCFVCEAVQKFIGIKDGCASVKLP